MSEKKELTRAKAERIIARTTDLNVLESDVFLKHKNKHVVAKAKTKLAKLI